MILEIYIDKQFLIKLYHRTDKGHEIIKDFIYNFLKKVRNVKLYLNVDFSEFKLLCDQYEYFDWLSEVPTIRFENWALKIDEKSKSNSISKIFLIEGNVDVNHLIKTYGYLYLNNNNIIERWNAVRVERDNDFISINDFSKPFWENLNDLNHPFNSLIVFDRYILDDKDRIKIKNNLIPLLNFLLSSWCNSKNVKEIAIISEKFFSKKNYEDSEKIKQAHFILTQALKSNDQIEIIEYNKSLNRSLFQNEHDRFILTNYLYLESGSGFNIYDNSLKPINHVKVSIRSIFKNSNRNVIENSLKNLSNYVAELKEKRTVDPPRSKDESHTISTYLPYYPSKTHRMLNYRG